MSLPSSAPIRLQQVATELSVGLPITLAASNVRTLFGVPSGSIRLLQGLGKTNIIGVHFDSFSVLSTYTTFLSTITGYNFSKDLSTADGASGKPAIYAYSSTYGYFYYSYSSGTPNPSMVIKVRASYAIDYFGSVTGIDPAASILQWSTDGSTWNTFATLTTLVANYSTSITPVNVSTIKVRAVNYHTSGGNAKLLTDYSNDGITYFYDLLVSNG